jgi:hypothetical protein
LTIRATAWEVIRIEGPSASATRGVSVISTALLTTHTTSATAVCTLSPTSASRAGSCAARCSSNRHITSVAVSTSAAGPRSTIAAVIAGSPVVGYAHRRGKGGSRPSPKHVTGVTVARTDRDCIPASITATTSSATTIANRSRGPPPVAARTPALHPHGSDPSGAHPVIGTGGVGLRAQWLAPSFSDRERITGHLHCCT